MGVFSYGKFFFLKFYCDKKTLTLRYKFFQHLSDHFPSGQLAPSKLPPSTLWRHSAWYYILIVFQAHQRLFTLIFRKQHNITLRLAAHSTISLFVGGWLNYTRGCCFTDERFTIRRCKRGGSNCDSYESLSAKCLVSFSFSFVVLRLQNFKFKCWSLGRAFRDNLVNSAFFLMFPESI